MFIRKSLAASAIVFWLMTATAFAQGPHGGDRQMMGRAAAELNLTDSQKASAKTIFEESSSASRATMDSLRTVRESMAAAIKANKSDSELAMLANQEGQLMGQLALVRARAAVKFYAQLTAEQKLIADKMPGDLLGFGSGFGQGGGRGRGPYRDHN